MGVFKCSKSISFNYSVQHKTLAKALLTRTEDRNNFLRSSWAAQVAAHPWPACHLQYIVQGNFSGCLSGWQAQVVWNTQTCILHLQTAESEKAETMSAAAGVRTRVSHANNCVLFYWPPGLLVIQESCAKGRVWFFCYSVRHAEDESGYTSLTHTLLLCADREMLSLISLCVRTLHKQSLQNLAKVAHANYGLMSAGLIFIHWESWSCCQKRRGKKDHIYRSKKIKVWWNWIKREITKLDINQYCFCSPLWNTRWQLEQTMG